MLSLVLGLLRIQGIPVICYLGELPLMEQSAPFLEHTVTWTVETRKRFGFSEISFSLNPKVGIFRPDAGHSSFQCNASPRKMSCSANSGEVASNSDNSVNLILHMGLWEKQ